VHLLAEYGGVWADSTLLCNGPLDAWVYTSTPPCSPLASGRTRALWASTPSRRAPPTAPFWAPGRASSSGGKTSTPRPRAHACSWFLVSTRHSECIHAWRSAVDAYWLARLRGEVVSRGYFWLDALFMQLDAVGAAFADAWASVAEADCDGHAGPHMLGFSSHQPLAEAQRQTLLSQPPHVLKLSRHLLPPKLGFWPACHLRLRACVWLRDSAAFEAVQLSLRAATQRPQSRAEARARLGGAEGSGEMKEGLLLSNCSSTGRSAQLYSVLREAWRRSRTAGSAVAIRDACSFCNQVPRSAGITCLPVEPGTRLS